MTADVSHTLALARALRRARIDRDLSQEVVADRAGTTAKVLSTYETAKRDPRAGRLVRLLDDGLEMEVAEFFELYRRARAGDRLTPPRR